MSEPDPSETLREAALFLFADLDTASEIPQPIPTTKGPTMTDHDPNTDEEQLHELWSHLFGDTAGDQSTDTILPANIVPREGANPTTTASDEERARLFVRDLLGHPGIQTV